jgi:hypothetical protein
VNFKSNHEKWLEAHLKVRSGERLRRLKEGHAHGEKLFLEQVWWPAVGQFEHLHPEYEVYDFRDGVRYLDFAYLRPPYRVDVEVDSFGSHSRDDRRKFSDDLMRQNHLVLDGWTVIRFCFDDVKDKPRQCQQIVQQMLGKLYGGSGEVAFDALPLKQREILRFAIRSARPITPSAINEHVGISNKYAQVILRRMVVDGILMPASGKHRVRSYTINPTSGFNKLFL